MDSWTQNWFLEQQRPKTKKQDIIKTLASDINRFPHIVHSIEPNKTYDTDVRNYAVRSRFAPPLHILLDEYCSNYNYEFQNENENTILEKVKILVEAGADINNVENHGYTPLDIIIRHGQTNRCMNVPFLNEMEKLGATSTMALWKSRQNEKRAMTAIQSLNKYLPKDISNKIVNLPETELRGKATRRIPVVNVRGNVVIDGTEAEEAEEPAFKKNKVGQGRRRLWLEVGDRSRRSATRSKKEHLKTEKRKTIKRKTQKRTVKRRKTIKRKK